SPSRRRTTRARWCRSSSERTGPSTSSTNTWGPPVPSGSEPPGCRPVGSGSGRIRTTRSDSTLEGRTDPLEQPFPRFVERFAAEFTELTDQLDLFVVEVGGDIHGDRDQQVTPTPATQTGHTQAAQ